MKRRIFNYLLEGIIVSLVNLALLALVNERTSSSFKMPRDGMLYWELLLMCFSLCVALLCAKIKKLQRRKMWIISGVYCLVPVVVDLSFRHKRRIEFDDINSPLWMFLIVMIIWTIIRIEVNQLIKK